MKTVSFLSAPRLPAPLFSAVAAVALLSLSACASGPDVRAMSDTSVNFGQYQTFGFASPLGTDQGGYQSIVSQYLKAATTRELQARGLRYDAANPQLIVNFNASLADKLRTSTTSTPTMGVGAYGGRGYYGYRTGLYNTWPLYQDQTTVTQYKEGTLNIDVADAARKQLVWEGVVTDSVTTKMVNNLEPALNAAVASAFAKFPVAKPAAPR